MKLYGEMAAVVALVIVGVTLMEVKESNAARILMAVPIGTRSHMNFFMPIAEHLVQRNHTVTYLSGYESSNKHPNIRVIFVPDIQIFNNMQQLFTTDSRTAMTSILDDMKRTCIKALAYEGVQRLVDEKFDLVILHIAFSECFLSFVHNLKIPFIFVNPNKVVGAYGPIAGTPAFPALLNSFFIDLEYPLTFTGRMISTLYDILLMTTYDWFVISRYVLRDKAI
ncbi:hypothetical protein GWK47_036503 [Chionoecetes opilio]|uniref:UDP-glucuronosyltransferase n=1 Tax=Chionoecetes opilio TaxID=41210 RepID=A0A8J4YMF6_CHIOP|nr:hypothetical protein GWK47_036503 [Chionoecetes opilio]